jgi:hypothetical protein
MTISLRSWRRRKRLASLLGLRAVSRCAIASSRASSLCSNLTRPSSTSPRGVLSAPVTARAQPAIDGFPGVGRRNACRRKSDRWPTSRRTLTSTVVAVSRSSISTRRSRGSAISLSRTLSSLFHGMTTRSRTRGGRRLTQTRQSRRRVEGLLRRELGGFLERHPPRPRENPGLPLCGDLLGGNDGIPSLPLVVEDADD